MRADYIGPRPGPGRGQRARGIAEAVRVTVTERKAPAARAGWGFEVGLGVLLDCKQLEERWRGNSLAFDFQLELPET